MRKQILKEGSQVCIRGNKLWRRYLHLVVLLGRAICGGLGRGRKPTVIYLHQDLRWSRRKLCNWEVFQIFPNQGKGEIPASINHCRQTSPDRNYNLGWSSSSSLQPRAISERDSKLPATNILINWKNWCHSPEGKGLLHRIHFKGPLNLFKVTQLVVFGAMLNPHLSDSKSTSLS